MATAKHASTPPGDPRIKLPLFARANLHPAALAWADAHARDDAPWCVAFSGGADSLALLLTLCAHWPERHAAKKIIALHFNHHLRAAASNADEKFCIKTCAALRIPLRTGQWTHTRKTNTTGIPKSASQNPHTSESAAREARHAFFAREMSTLGAHALFLGHQLDDIAETQLMRLARGSSTTGLAAPRPMHAHADGRIFLRPLLTLSKRQITTTLRARKLSWREDTTNTTTPDDLAGNYFRNRIRRDVLPAFIAAAENDALAGAALTREFLDEDATALDTWLAELMPNLMAQTTRPRTTRNILKPSTLNFSSNFNLNLQPLANKPRALFRRALRRWPPAADLARPGFENLLSICIAGSGRTSIGEHIAIMENGILRLQPYAPQSPHSTFSIPHSAILAPPFSLNLPDGSCLTAERLTLTPALRARILAREFDPIHTIFIALPPTPFDNTVPQKLISNTPRIPTVSRPKATTTPTPSTPALIIRPPQPGDRYRPLGAPGTSKLSDLLINRKIPASQRATLPVICTAPATKTTARKPQATMHKPHSEILWVPGLPPADAWKITKKISECLHLTYQRGTYTVRT